MVRTVLAVVAGYATLAVLVMLAFSVAIVAPDFAFQPGSAEVTHGWMAYVIAASFAAAVAAGAVATRVGRGPRPARILAGLVLVFGLFEAARNAQKTAPQASAAEIAAMSVMDKAQAGVQPRWYSLVLPFLGATGVLTGAVAGRRCGLRSALVQSSA